MAKKTNILLIVSSFVMSAGTVWAEIPSPGAKFIKVEERPVGNLINIQIDPEEQALLLEPSSQLEPPEQFPEVDPEGLAATSDAANWFWSGVSPGLVGTGALRIEDALQQLTNAPTDFITPRVSDLQVIVDQYGADILIASLQAQVSPAFILAVIGTESAGKAEALSDKGAIGLMQLIPATAERFGVEDPTDPAQNIAGGARYLRWLLDNFQGDPILALAGYNAGENAVTQANGVPPYDETRNYVPKVVAAWQAARLLCTAAPVLVTEPCVFRSQLSD